MTHIIIYTSKLCLLALNENKPLVYIVLKRQSISLHVVTQKSKFDLGMACFWSELQTGSGDLKK